MPHSTPASRAHGALSVLLRKHRADLAPEGRRTRCRSGPNWAVLELECTRRQRVHSA
eukprot:IDg14978t1